MAIMCGMVVYAVQQGTGGAVKIGRANDIGRRLKSLQTGSPAPLVVLATWPGGAELEHEMHVKYAEYRLHGEWFDAAIVPSLTGSGPCLPHVAPKKAMNTSELRAIVDRLGGQANSARLTGYRSLSLHLAYHGARVTPRLAARLREADLSAPSREEIEADLLRRKIAGACLGAELGPQSMQNGRPRTVSDMTTEELNSLVNRLGGYRKAAEVIGMSRYSMLGYVAGKRLIPQPQADKLRASI